MREELNIKGIDTITGFLGFFEKDIINKTTLFGDFLILQQKFDYPELKVRLYNLYTGGLGFQVIVDFDNENKIITQRTWYRNGTDSKELFEHLTKEAKFHQLGKALYLPRLKKDVFINLEEGNGELHFKCDVW